MRLLFVWGTLQCTGFGLQAADLPQSLSHKDFLPFDEKQAALGQLLFYDPILSGNRNISCGTCHNHDLGGADGLSLGIGEGGIGIGPKRTTGTGDNRIKKRIPRNAPALWNLGFKEIEVLFHDGRLHKSDIYDNGFNSPAEEWLPTGLNDILAVQAIFPLAAQFEMAGNPKENQIAGALHDRIDAVWPIVAKRVRTNPKYAELFIDGFAEVETALDINISHIANALSAFINAEWRSFDSPFDNYLAGQKTALSSPQQKGLDLFFDKANCSDCHSGALFTDQNFYALAVPQFGPGRTRRFDPAVRDVGLMGTTDRIEDAYRFRTPSLRNVALTAPYGHTGAFRTLRDVITHHLDPIASLNRWSPDDVDLPKAEWISHIDFAALSDQREQDRIRRRIDITPIDLTKDEITALVEFLHALTGTASKSGRLGKPLQVPSGLPID